MTAHGSHYRGAGVPDRPTVLQTPQRRTLVNNRSVECPVCHAPEGQNCLNVDGGSLSYVHDPRRRMAIRARNQAMQVNVVDLAANLTGAERKRLREKTGLTLVQVAAVLGCQPNAVMKAESSNTRWPVSSLEGHRAYSALLALWGSR